MLWPRLRLLQLRLQCTGQPGRLATALQPAAACAAALQARLDALPPRRRSRNSKLRLASAHRTLLGSVVVGMDELVPVARGYERAHDLDPLSLAQRVQLLH